MNINANQALSQKLLQILTKASPDHLNAGDILQGRVQSLDNGMLLLKLLDGTFFTAKVPEGFTTSFGELMTLEIGERQNDQLTARILPHGQQQLTVNGNEISLKNEVIQKLISLGSTEKLAGQVLELLKAEPELPVDQAAFIAVNKLDAAPEIHNILHKISENEFQLHDNLHSLKSGLTAALAEMSGSLRQSILKPLLTEQGLDRLSELLKDILPANPQSLKESIIQNIRELLSKTLLNEMTASDQVKQDTTQLIDRKVLEGFLSKAFAPSGMEAGLPVFKPEAMDKLLETVNQVIEDIHTKTSELPKAENKDIEPLLEKLFDKAVIKAENGNIEDVDIKEKAKALREIMDFSHKVISQADNKTQDLNLPAFKEIDSAFRFFSQVTSYDTLLQLPLKINRENTSGELYVMKRKNGRKKLDSENFTLFLSLQTASLGRVESFLNASHKCVTISFRVEQEELVKLVKDNYRALYDSLLKKGYKLAEMKCRVLADDKTNLFNAGLKAREYLGMQASLDLKI